MSSLTVLEQPTVLDSKPRPEDNISVFHQLRDFRSQVPKNILRSWEEPTGYAALW